MLTQLRWSVLGAVLVGSLLAGVGGCALSQTVTPVPNLDLNRLRGTWYEIAKYPFKPSKQCLNNSFELIALNSAPRSVQLVDSCVTKRIYSDPTHTAATQAKNGSGELRIRHLLIFHKTRDVIAIAADNSWFVIGSANHKDLWIYSKSATIPDETFATLEAQAVAQGFAAAKIVKTPQNIVAAQTNRNAN